MKISPYFQKMGGWGLRAFLHGAMFLFFLTRVTGPAYASTAITVANTTPQPGTLSACPGSTVEAFVFKITNNLSMTQYINSMELDFSGTGSLNDGTVGFYEDVDKNGLVDGADVSLLGASFIDTYGGAIYYDTGGVSEPSIAPGASVDFIVTITFNSTAPAGKTYQMVMNQSNLWMDTDGSGLTALPPTTTYNAVSPLITLGSSCGNTDTPTYTVFSTSSPTATATMTNTSTLVFTATPVHTSTMTASVTPSATASLSATASSTPTLMFTGTFTNTPTVTDTLTVTATVTVTATNISTSTATPTNTVTNSPTLGNTATTTNTQTVTSTCTVTNTVPTSTNTFTPTVTGTPTNTPTRVIPYPVAYPNPIQGPGPVYFRVPLTDPENVQVDLFTVAFRCVRSIDFGLVVPKQDVVVTLVDKAGLPLANGLYYAKVTMGGLRYVTKLLVLR